MKCSVQSTPYPSQCDGVEQYNGRTEPLDLNQEESKCIPPDIHPCALRMGSSDFYECDRIRSEFSQDELDSIAKEKWSVATGQKRDSLAREFRDEIGFLSPEVCLFQFEQKSARGFAFGKDSLKVMDTRYHGPKLRFSIYRNQKNGKLHEKIYDADGNLRRTVSYKNGVKEGKEKMYDEYGNKVNESIYKNGVIQKKIQYGNYSDILNYRGFLDSGCKAYYSWKYEKNCNCVEKYKEKIFQSGQTLYRNGIIYSKTVFYYPCYDGDGSDMGVNKIYRTANYKNGELNGTVKEFYPNGKIKSTVTYEDGEAVSEKKCFSKNGKVQKIGTENMKCD